MGDNKSLDQVLANVDSGRRGFLKTLLLGAAAVPMIVSVALTDKAEAAVKKKGTPETKGPAAPKPANPVPSGAHKKYEKK